MSFWLAEAIGLGLNSLGYTSKQAHEHTYPSAAHPEVYCTALLVATQHA